MASTYLAVNLSIQKSCFDLLIDKRVKIDGTSYVRLILVWTIDNLDENLIAIDMLKSGNHVKGFLCFH